MLSKNCCLQRYDPCKYSVQPCDNPSLQQVQILKEHLFKTESKIQAGLGRYTWQSMNIKQFCDKCLLVNVKNWNVSHSLALIVHIPAH